jgi:hypothetical protein
MTTLSRALPLILVGAMMAAGCQKTPEPKTSATTTEAPVAPVSQSSSTSVALPKDKMPQSDAAIAPQAPGATASSGDSGTPSQVRPEQLSKQQEQSSLPMSGQVNNHSTPNTTPPDKKE